MMTVRFFSLFLVAFGLSTSPILSYAMKFCHKIVPTHPSPSLKVKNLLNFKIGEQMRASLNLALSANHDARAEEVIHHYLEARLPYLAQPETERLLDILNKRINFNSIPVANEEALSVDWYNPKERSINVTVIERYSDTILRVSALIHQIEHAIQHLHAPWTPYHFMDPRHYLVHHFEKEKGAMIAEGVYLLSVSKANLEALIERIESDIGLPYDFKQAYLNRLKPAYNSTSVEQYVRSQWRNDRNSRSDLVGQQLAATAGPIAAIPLLWHIFNQLKND